MGHIDGAEVAKHNNKKSCWIVLDSKAYDVTSFMHEHPGGAPIILKNAGTVSTQTHRLERNLTSEQDATEEFKKYHPLDYLNDYLPADALLGPVDPNTFGQLRQNKDERAAPASETDTSKELPHLSMCVSSTDFQQAAKAVLPHKSYIYASTSANTGLSLKGNLDDWGRINFRPMGTMGAIHPGAELEMYKGAVRKGIHAVVSTASSKSSEQIMQSFVEESEKMKGASPTRLFYQYYMPVDRKKAIELMGIVKRCGYKGLWITVDTPVLGKRTTDRYLQAEEALAIGIEEESTASWEANGDNAFAPAMGGRPAQGQLSPHTTWEDLAWIRKEWDGPIVLKGVQCVEDAKLAMEYGCDGILLSNHGGRQLHTAPSALMTLCEIKTYCPEVLKKLERWQ
jgi:L-lactate dehydrogenase (cytochrome)